MTIPFNMDFSSWFLQGIAEYKTCFDYILTIVFGFITIQCLLKNPDGRVYRSPVKNILSRNSVIGVTSPPMGRRLVQRFAICPLFMLFYTDFNKQMDI
jgi:hypothetical protein